MIAKNKEIIKWLAYQPDKIYEIKEWHEKRSLNANSYFYVLQNKMAQVLKTSNDELHEQLIKRYSNATLITLPKENELKGLIKYYDVYKSGEIKGIPVVIYKAYKPSHEMNTKEFSRLLDGIISECKDLNIETMSPEEIRRLDGYEV